MSEMHGADYDRAHHSDCRGDHETIAGLTYCVTGPLSPTCGHFSFDHDGNCMTCEREAARRADMARAVREHAPLIRRAILDPGAFVKRGPDYDGNAYGERLDQWQDRAIEAAISTVFPPAGGGDDR